MYDEEEKCTQGSSQETCGKKSRLEDANADARIISKLIIKNLIYVGFTCVMKGTSGRSL
jgi:hypothetical protein